MLETFAIIVRTSNSYGTKEGEYTGYLYYPTDEQIKELMTFLVNDGHNVIFARVEKRYNLLPVAKGAITII